MLIDYSILIELSKLKKSALLEQFINEIRIAGLDDLLIIEVVVTNDAQGQGGDHAVPRRNLHGHLPPHCHIVKNLHVFVHTEEGELRLTATGLK